MSLDDTDGRSALASSPRPVLMIGTDGEVDVFASVHAAELYLEAIDVSNGEVAIIVDGFGIVYRAMVEPKSVRTLLGQVTVDAVTIEPSEPAAQPELERILWTSIRAFLARPRVQEVLVSRGVDPGLMGELDVWRTVRALCSAWPRTA